MKNELRSQGYSLTWDSVKAEKEMEKESERNNERKTIIYIVFVLYTILVSFYF